MEKVVPYLISYKEIFYFDHVMSSFSPLQSATMRQHTSVTLFFLVPSTCHYYPQQIFGWSATASLAPGDSRRHARFSSLSLIRLEAHLLTSLLDP
jgi:hypothetical protein